MRSKYMRFWVLIVAVSFLSPSAFSTTYTYNFSGAIGETNNAAIPVGMLFSGTFTYDNAATPAGCGGNFCNFQSSLASLSSNIAPSETGGWQITIHDVTGVFLPAPLQQYDIFEESFGDPAASYSAMYFLDANQTAFANSLDLPPVLDLNSFEYVFFSYSTPDPSCSNCRFYSYGAAQVTGPVASAPEPVALSIVLSGLFLLPAIGRKKQDRSI